MGAPPRTALPLLGLVFSGAMLGSGHVCARLAFTHGVSLLTAAAVRVSCAALIVAIVVLARRIRLAAPPRERLGALALGVFVTAQTLLVQVGVKHLPVTLALLLFYTYPLFTATVSGLIGAHAVTRRLMVSLLAAFAGLALVLGVTPGGVDTIGVMGAVGAALVFTGTLVLTPRLAPGVAAPLRTLFTMAAGATILWSLAVGTDNVQWPATTIAWSGLAGLSLFYGMGIAGLFLLLPRLGPVQTAVVLNLEPVFVAIIAWVALGEALTPVQMAGAAIVVAAVIASQLRPAD